MTYVHNNKAHFFSIASIVLCLIFALSSILVNLNRYWQYESGYYDFGIFGTAIWKVAHFSPPIIDHFVVSGKHIFADHVSPTIFLFSPVFWFTNASEVLFVMQDVCVALSGYVLYRISVFKLKNELLSLSILISYFMFAGLQNAVYFDFHEVTLGTLFFMLTYWAIISKHKKLYFLFFILSLGCKESLFLWGVGTAFFIFFYQKSWRKIALFSFFISVLWGFVTIKLIIPYYLGSFYQYNPHVSFFSAMQSLIYPSIKLKTVFLSLASFSFLPLLTPSFFPSLLLHYGHRFLTEGSVRWDLGLHYNAEIAPTLAVSTVLAVDFVQTKLKLHNMATLLGIGIIATSLFLFRFVTKGALGLATNPVYYQHTKDFIYLDKLVSRIPSNTSIATQNNLASHFITQKAFILREGIVEKYKPDYVLFDLRDGQNPNNFLGIQDTKKLLQSIRTNPNYLIVYQDNTQYVFKKK